LMRDTRETSSAARLTSEVLERDRRPGDRRDEVLALHNLAMVALARGDRDEGVRLAHDAASVAESIGFDWMRGVTLLATAERLIAAGEPDAAADDFHAGLVSLASVRDQVKLPIAIAAGAAIAAQRGDGVQAGTLWGALEVAAEREPKPTTEQAIAEYLPFVERVRGEEFEQSRSHGRTLSLDEAVEYALANLH
jgi:hypothetical protein